VGKIIPLGKVAGEIWNRIAMRENHHTTTETRTGQLRTGDTFRL
jgi:hypothetical protein